ncbi:metal-sensitive transcriptional regulator [Carboxydothermus pertinax]|uniref:Transcriptional regulator n=1 Tax=Carboxydothermus pertinax TaxID=870242 RepID=A0A1L8CUD7_9THEO|nr:metal-sensitive transcriptional regulator [Carboxydothermus pertinax]GAV22507.1 transcriptional regulator [Carboxydothermus pertinax]
MYVRDKEGILRRLKLLEGQIRGIAKMVEEDRYCIDILNQIEACKGALEKVALLVLEGHLKGCVKRAIKTGEEEPVIQELLEVLDKFIK